MFTNDDNLIPKNIILPFNFQSPYANRRTWLTDISAPHTDYCELLPDVDIHDI